MSNHLMMLSASEELIARPASRAVRIAVGVALFLVIGGLIGAALYRIDVYATAPGRVQPIGRSKTVQAPEQARVVQAYVREGSHVVKGQVLVRLDPTSTIFDRDAAHLQQLALLAEIARRQAESRIGNGGMPHRPRIAFPDLVPEPDRAREQAVLDGDIAQLRAERAVFTARIAGDRAREIVLRQMAAQRLAQLDTLRIKLANRRLLNAEGWKSGADVLDTEAEADRASADQLSGIQEAVTASADASGQQAEMAASVAKLLKDNADQLEQAEQKLGQIQQQYLKSSNKTEGLVIRAPVTGTVQALAVTTIGQVANVGEALMTIVPDASSVQVEALVSDRDMGFIAKGQEVIIKVRAYPYTRYGVIHGRVSGIARDSISSRDASDQTDTSTTAKPYDDPSASPLPHVQDLVYPVVIDLESASLDVDGVVTPIKPGMATEVEIRTATRSVLEYIFSPLMQTLSASGHER